MVGENLKRRRTVPLVITGITIPLGRAGKIGVKIMQFFIRLEIADKSSMVVSTRRSSCSFSVPPLPTYASTTGTTNRPVVVDRKKARTSNARGPPRPPTSRKLQPNGSAPSTANANPNVEFLDTNRNVPAWKDLAKVKDESPSDLPALDGTSGHFLQGINVEKCIDVLSIPDPPTPRTAEKLQRKRRQSSPFILEPLRFKENNDLSKPSRSSKSRKSLSYLPFSHELPDWTLPHDAKLEWQNTKGKHGGTELHDVTNNTKHRNTPSGSGSGSSSSNREKTLLTTPCCTTSNDDDTEPTTAIHLNFDKLESVSYDFDSEKRRKLPAKKRRESIVLPFELFSDDPSEGKPTSTHIHVVSTEPNVAAPQDDSILTSEKSTFDWHHIGQLIREIMSLAPSSRSTCEQAASLEKMTGYPLIPPSQRLDPTLSVDLNWSSSPSHPRRDSQHLDSRRRQHFMTHVAPNMQKLENMKTQEEKDVQVRTNTRVQKVKFKYHYFDITTGRRIASEQYKQRYMAMLDENLALEDSKAHVWLANLPSSESLAGDELKLDRDESSSPIVPNPRPMEEDMELCFQDEHSCDLKQNKSSEYVEPFAEEIYIEPKICAVVSSPLILPLPEIDKESSDPDIARAERRLWAAMDAALETYSAEVLAIMASKDKSFPSA